MVRPLDSGNKLPVKGMCSNAARRKEVVKYTRNLTDAVEAEPVEKEHYSAKYDPHREKQEGF